ncbi:MAG: ice-binding family protein [Rhodospirillales bacterium]
MRMNQKSRRAALLPLLVVGLAGSAAAYAAGPPAVNLRSAGRFVILSKSGIADVPKSTITGNIATSPITGAADHVSCTEVTGRILSVNAAGPGPCGIARPLLLTTAIHDMQTAYTDAAGRAPDVTELGAGNIGGLTIPPGVYKWSSGVIIPTDVTLKGTCKNKCNDVWIFQIAQNLKIADGTAIRLSGGARGENIFWQVAGQVTIGTTAGFRGVALCKTLIAAKTGAVINGRLLAQTAVTLEMNVVHQPH